MMDSLSRNVTALVLAIDPDSKHGPETAKIVAYQEEVRKWTIHLVQTINPYDDDHQSATQTKASRKLRELLDLKS
jgi:hypothetical protein